ncbi:serine/threonine-protein kinase [Alienimonas chondri]|uniref:Serine/threonine-protein kinase PknD n=1 Tax=Alienimonas chondri TaxID=2681879 RepID=A0ABX1VD60_9PLAN|nr:serine/threonine-protein kinase [Alienimonas chondri]NNJ25356.1 Serine/threonine-protein kinase PknD [Alienimonas chondri]
MSLAAGPSADSTDDDALAGVLDALLEDAEAGRPVDLEAACVRHPAFAKELRELFNTAGLMREFLPSGDRSSDDGLAETVVSGRETPADRTLGEPRRNAPHPPPGYEIRDELGRGGMGVVYRAFQSEPGREVALKMIRQAALASPEDAARFRREAEATARLDDPHIVPVFEVGGFEGEDASPFFSMRLIEGSTLDAELRKGPRPPRELAATLAPIARAIDTAHRAGVLHRDLKPSNILLDALGRPFVTDFGLAGRAPQPQSLAGAMGEDAPTLTQPGAILGTPAWMSPEQAAGRREAVGPASDVYSLGAILYAGLTGRPPFSGETPAATVMRVLESEPRRPRRLNEDADPDLELIALKCLQKPQDLRYVSAAALADDLEAYLAGEPVSARGGRFTDLVHRTFRETHHAPILENWGLLWMWHAAVLVALCLVTNVLQIRGVESRPTYVLMWTAGMGAWAAVFWGLRRRAGPISFVERQIAHVWAASMVSSSLLFAIEWLLGMDVLYLSPVLGLIAGAVFFAKAGMLSGALYIPAVACFLTALLMAWMEATLPRHLDWGVLLFGLVTGAGFFFPGWKYRR